MKTLRFLAGLWASLILAATPALAANLTPDQLTNATSIANGDLLVIYPSGGPMKSVDWSVAVSQMQIALGATYLQVANNLNDVASPSSARTNLGLGTAALIDTGTSGGTLCLLNASCAFTLAPTLGANSTTNPEIYFTSGSLLTTPVAGALEWDGTNLFVTQSGPTRQTLVYSTDARFAGPAQNSQSGGYTFAATDCGGEAYHPSSDTTARTWTLPANGSVPISAVCKIEIVNDCSAGALTLAITTDTLEWFPSGGTGSRTIAACGMASLTKVTSTKWVLTGTGVS